MYTVTCSVVIRGGMTRPYYDGNVTVTVENLSDTLDAVYRKLKCSSFTEINRTDILITNQTIKEQSEWR